MKITSQISTGQFEYSKMEEDIDGDFSYDVYALKAKGLDEAHRAAFQKKPQHTLPDKEFTDFIYSQLHGTGNHIESWERMNNAQRTFVNQLKKALTRKPPMKKEPIDDVTWQGAGPGKGEQGDWSGQD